MIGADTVGASAAIEEWYSRGIVGARDSALQPTGKHGSVGVVWWRELEAPDGERFIFKHASPHVGYLTREGSVPKSMGDGLLLADGAAVRAYLEGLQRSSGIGEWQIYRLDAATDMHDPARRLIEAAVGWQPHPRARYVEAVYQGGETVFLRNKSRGIRVYDKFAESGDVRAAGVVRLEYQMRRRWVQTLQLQRVDAYWDERLAEAVEPLREDLTVRAGFETMIGTMCDAS